MISLRMIHFQKIESVQYRAPLPITGTIKDTLGENLYQELRLEYLHQRRQMKLLRLYKILLTKLPAYICNLVPPMKNSARHFQYI